MPSLQTLPYVYSSLGSDLDLANSVEKFVDELPCRIEKICAEVAKQDWYALECLAHQLKGSSRSYGFEEVADLSAQLEAACLATPTELDILSTVDRLLSVCERVRAGAPR